MSEWSEEHLKRAKEGTEYYIEKAILDSKEIESLKSKLSLSTKREEIYRRALEEIVERIMETYGDCPSSIQRLGREGETALNDGKEKEDGR